ncbi:cytoplasmic protein [Mycena galopus ATCC 62051]|nr:cytoplasmic protein [Mycena galopus ATCC 62051]
MDSELSNTARPKTSATLTVRIIKSFEFRTEKSLVLHNINLETTTAGELKNLARAGTKSARPSPFSPVLLILAISNQSGWKPYRNVVLDTLKLYTKAHGAKTTNLIINLDHDDWILGDDNKLLADLGFENETEVSFFNQELYARFLENPQTSWDC